MPRKKHKWYPGAKLHVIARGNRRNDIFRDRTDYELYLNYLQEAIEYYDNRYHIIAYTLMTNHVHLEVASQRGQTPGKDCKKVSKWNLPHWRRKNWI